MYVYGINDSYYIVSMDLEETLLTALGTNVTGVKNEGLKNEGLETFEGAWRRGVSANTGAAVRVKAMYPLTKGLFRV